MTVILECRSLHTDNSNGRVFQQSTKQQLMCFSKPGMAAEFGSASTERLAETDLDKDQSTVPGKPYFSQSVTPVRSSSHRKNDTYYCQKDFYVQLQTQYILHDCNFYFADISSYEAKQILKSCSVGTFLIRDSSDSRYLYTISVKTKRGPTSIRVSYEHGRFSLDSDEKSKHQMPQFPSIMELVDFYVRKTNRRNLEKCRFLDKSGRKDLPIILSEPKLKEVQSLKHLCRLSINQSLSANSADSLIQLIDKLPAPKPLRSFLKDYPYIC